MTQPCYKCGRPSAKNHAQCPVCLRYTHVKLNHLERDALVAILVSVAEQADRVALTVACLAAAETIRRGRTPGLQQLELIENILYAICSDVEQRTGLLDLACEHLYRKVMHFDRRTEGRTPWACLIDENRCRLDMIPAAGL